MIRMSRWFCVLLIWILIAPAVWARGVYQDPEDFISEVFSGKAPPPSLLQISEDEQKQIREILGHKLGAGRVRYWQHEDRTVWILEEIGKERPITVGLVVDKGKLELIKVLIFRESRGSEVRYPFFTDQFKGASLGEDGQLDRNIDGVSGATLSTRALTKLARLALYLHQQREQADVTGQTSPR
ncbi:MAG: FMN-binding protein [Gammaproteobacteria bacterium]|nr:MAG: FMN-binding protein [Gammaproteobacteria bacterium]